MKYCPFCGVEVEAAGHAGRYPAYELYHCPSCNRCFAITEDGTSIEVVDEESCAAD